MEKCVTTLWDERDAEDSPICGACGVSMLPAEVPGEQPTCENAECPSFYDAIH